MTHIKSKILFYILSFTWGLPMTFVGLVVAGILLCTGRKPIKYGYCWHFAAGNGWGGVSLGIIMITSSNSGIGTKDHEHGHAVQNCYYGPVHVIFSIMSAVRYHYRNYLKHKNPSVVLPDYDSFWFEAQATNVGADQIDYINGEL